jgi:(p)ppGpp synthase/HD superfamily hydrolase
VHQIWKKDKELGDVDQQEDLVAWRMVVAPSAAASMRSVEGDRALCARAQEVIHRLLSATELRPGQDFIRFPKENGYQALHSIVRIPGYPSPVEIQVRTLSSRAPVPVAAAQER